MQYNKIQLNNAPHFKSTAYHSDGSKLNLVQEFCFGFIKKEDFFLSDFDI